MCPWGNFTLQRTAVLTEVFSFPVDCVTVSSGRAYLDVDITLSSEAFHNYMNAAMVHINRALKLIIRLFLVEDLVDSLKVSCCSYSF